jgi:TP901 family phage tail tape measure protein
VAERELAIVIRAKDLASRAIAGVNSNLNNMGRQASRGLSNAAGNIERGIAVAGGAAVAGLAYSVKVAGDFEAQMNTLNTIARATGDAFSGELGEIGDRLRKLARDTGTPLEELTTAYYDLLSAGISTAHAQDVLTASNTLAIGGLATTAETVDLLTTAINSYGGDASKAGEYADNFAVAIERGKVTAAEIAAGFSQVGAMAANMNIGVDETSAILAQMTAKGAPAAEVFTMMRAAMVALQRQTPEMKQVLDELNISNVEAEVASRGLVPVWEDLRAKADELGIPLIKLTGRVEGANFALMNTGENFESYNEHLAAVREGTGTAQEQMAERQQGLNYQMDRMKAILSDVAITLGSKLIPKIVPMLQRLAEYIEGNQEKISAWADDVAEGFEDAVKWAMSLDWNAIANSLKMAADFSRGLVEAFLGMPDWVKQAVITGWGLNKLTGGAVGSIVGSLASGLIKGVLGINAGVVNVKGAVVNSGPGTGAPAGPGGINPVLAAGLAVGAGVAVGTAIGGPIYEETTRPAIDFEHAQFTAVLESGDAERIGNGLSALNDQIHEFRSKPPQWQQIMEPTIRTLEDQRDALQAELQNIYAETERSTASIRDATPWAIRNVEEIHDLNASEGRRFGDMAQRTDRIGQQRISADARLLAAEERVRGEVSSKGAAALSKADAALAVARGHGVTLGSIRDMGSAALSKADAANTIARGHSTTLAAIRDKKTAVTIPVTVNIKQEVSISKIQSGITEATVATGGGQIMI